LQEAYPEKSYGNVQLASHGDRYFHVDAVLLERKVMPEPPE
jgi:hypothetical protein